MQKSLRMRWRQCDGGYEEAHKIINGNQVVLRRYNNHHYELQLEHKPIFKSINRALIWAERLNNELR